MRHTPLENFISQNRIVKIDHSTLRKHIVTYTTTFGHTIDIGRNKLKSISLKNNDNNRMGCY